MRAARASSRSTARLSLVLPLLALLSACFGQQCGQGPERSMHTATLLTNGKVLVAGGNNSKGSLSDVFLYDPAANGWTPTGSMAHVRQGHTATLLNNGDVLVVGGDDDSRTPIGAEVYSTSKGTWAATSSPPPNRVRHQAVLLKDGRVLVVGGSSSVPGTDSQALDSALLYGTDGSWSTTGSMHSPRFDFTATLLNDGRVLAVGGQSGAGVLATSEVYDPTTGTWSVDAPPSSDVSGHAATLLPDGRVLVVTQGSGTWLYTPAAAPSQGSWQSLPAPPQGRSSFVLLARGDTALVVGGELGAGGDNARSAELYRVGQSWSLSAPMSVGRWGHTATLLSSGQVLVVGGVSDVQSTEGYPFLATAELYDVDPDAWTSAGSIP